MSIRGYLVPYPDPGAADMMSDHLEQVVQASGPGTVLIRVELPRAPAPGPNTPAGSGGPFARKKLDLLQRDGEAWVSIWSATTDSDNPLEEVSVAVESPGSLKCRVTNMGGIEGQFSLDCAFSPSEES